MCLHQLQNCRTCRAEGRLDFLYFGQSPREVSEESEFHLVSMKTIHNNCTKDKKRNKIAGEIDIRYDWYSIVEHSNWKQNTIFTNFNFFTDGIMISTGSNGRQENTNDDDLHLYGSDTSNTNIGILVGLLVAAIILMWLLLLDAFVTVSEKSSK